MALTHLRGGEGEWPTAGQDDWESGLADVFKAAVRIAEDVH